MTAPAARTESDLVSWAELHGVDVRLHSGLPPVRTVRQAADVMGVAPGAIAKSVVFMNDGSPMVVLAPGDAKVVDRLVLDHVGGVRNRFRLARPSAVLQATGYPVGAVPPFGHPAPLPTLMERRLLDHGKLFFGGGSDRALLEVAPQEVTRVTDAQLGRFTA